MKFSEFLEERTPVVPRVETPWGDQERDPRVKPKKQPRRPKKTIDTEIPS